MSLSASTLKAKFKTHSFPVLKKIIFTVTNDLAYDQRMIRICSSLSAAGYQVALVGRQYRDSPTLPHRNFEQYRISCFFRKTVFFYVEYNLRLFVWLLGQQMHRICAIDLDTIIPCYYISRIKKIPRVYDAHELFCEMKEVVTRPFVHRIWKFIEKRYVSEFPSGYTVCDPIAHYFRQTYGHQYAVIRNIARYRDPLPVDNQERFILYQGAVNEGRCFEVLIPAMKWVPVPLRIYGDGNFLTQARSLIRELGLGDKVFLMGKALPEELSLITSKATIGISLFEEKGLNNYFSLANRFFDFIQAGIPQLCTDFPAYQAINDQYQVALLIRDQSAVNIAAALNKLLEDEVLYQELKKNCSIAARALNWENEEKVLIAFYDKN